MIYFITIGCILISIISCFFFFIYPRKTFIVHKKGIILITGASTGIGRHAAEYLAKKYSSYIILAGVRKISDANEIKDMKIDNLKPLMIDVTDHESCVNAIRNLKEIMQKNNLPIVALVNNAGIAQFSPIEFHRIDYIRKMFDTNLFAAIDLVQLTLPLLRESKGRIVNISSMAGVIALPTNAAYASSKFALEAFSDALRREVQQFGISVSIIQPAYVKTPLFNRTADEKINYQIKEANNVEYQSLYLRFSGEKAQKKRTKELENASEPIVTTHAIEDAIISDMPYTRYAVATSFGMQASILKWIFWGLSDRNIDSLVNA